MRRDVRQGGHGKDSSSSSTSSIWKDSAIKRIAAAGTLAREMDTRANKSLRFANSFQPAAQPVPRPPAPVSIQPLPPQPPRQREQQQQYQQEHQYQQVQPQSQFSQQPRQQPQPPRRRKPRVISDSESGEDQNVDSDGDKEKRSSQPKKTAPANNGDLPRIKPSGNAVSVSTSSKRTSGGLNTIRTDAMVQEPLSEPKTKVAMKRAASEVAASPPAAATTAISAATVAATLGRNNDGHRAPADHGTSTSHSPSKRRRRLLSEELGQVSEAPDNVLDREVDTNPPVAPIIHGTSTIREGETAAPAVSSAAHAGDTEDLLAALERELELS